MPLPTSYNEATLKAFMVNSLGALATTLGIDDASMAEAVNDVAAACGVTDVSQAADVMKLRAVAKVQALRVAQQVAAGWYDFSADGGDFKRSQVNKQIETLLSMAYADGLAYAGSYAIETGTVRVANDPYQFADGDEGVM